MPRSRIEGLLASFPKLIGASDQHTFVETDNVRYVYQPLEELFMVLVTNKQSNILQDIDTLHLFARSVSEYCRSLEEREIARQAFDLIAVFDEVVSLGYRENVGLAQLRTITEMESHEERVQAEIAKNKEKEAREELNRKARQLEMQKREMAKRGYTGGMTSSTGFGAGMGSGYGAGSGSMNAGFRAGTPYQDPISQSVPSQDDRFSSPTSAAPTRGKGMQLGRKAKDTILMDSIKAEEGLDENPPMSAGAGASVHHNPVIATESVHLAVEEKVVVIANRDGGLQSMEVKGDLMLRVSDPGRAQIRVALKVQQDPNIQYKTHPNVDKALFSQESILGLKDASRPFPTGQALGILRWRYVTKEESVMPLAINCWPSPSGNGSCDVNIEYELQSDRLELRDVVISIPYPGTGTPTIGDVEGHYQLDRQHHIIQWQLPIIDQSNKSGVLEFTVPSEDVGGFFPIKASFSALQTFCDVAILDVVSIHGDRVPFSKEAVLTTEDYSVV
ncbi:Coatomer subunit delta [Borealophlyctis nickersoniae]|nr:Coatomer subunit delta [Borealophlyctis nickersoniae]